MSTVHVTDGSAPRLTRTGSEKDKKKGGRRGLALATGAAAGRLAENRLNLENARGKFAVVEQDAIANCHCA
jgi:hypothetical protein